jgi:hypothetical protein
MFRKTDSALPVRFGSAGAGFVLRCVGLSPVALLHFDCADPGSRLLFACNQTAVFCFAMDHSLRRLSCHLDQLSGSRRRNAKRLSDIVRSCKTASNFDALPHLY